MKQHTTTAAAMGMALAGLLGAAPGASADDLPTKLSVHGFLAQAYGHAHHDSRTVLGIDSLGTTDYRNAALQFSYAATDKGRLVLQVAHERIGLDPKSAFLSDVELDWAFYEHQVADHTRARVGRFPLPIGIYNEIRDVGTVLPFYRPPAAFYGETNFLSETVDGVLVSQVVPLGDWSLRVEPFAGAWDTLAISGSTPLTPARADDAVGASAWVNTPVTGLRVGGVFFKNTLRRRAPAAPPVPPGAPANVPPAPAPEPRRVWMAAVDGQFSRFTVQAEYSKTKDGDSHDRSYYGLVSVKPTSKVSVNLLYSKMWVSWFGGRLAGNVSSGNRDMALGVNYALRPNLVAKLEAHDGEGLQPIGAPPTERYFLVSLAASF